MSVNKFGDSKQASSMDRTAKVKKNWRKIILSLRWKSTHAIGGVGLQFILVVQLFHVVYTKESLLMVLERSNQGDRGRRLWLTLLSVAHIIMLFPFLPIGLGFDKFFRPRLMAMGPLLEIYKSAMASTFAMAFSALSSYTNMRHGDFMNSRDMSDSFLICCNLLAAIFILWSQFVLPLMEYRKYGYFVSLGGGWTVEHVSTMTVLLWLPLLHWTLGNEGITQLYSHHHGNIGMVGCFIFLFTMFVKNIDVLIIGLVTSKRLSHDTYRTIGFSLWVGFYLSTIACFLWHWYTVKVAICFFIGSVMLLGACDALEHLLLHKFVRNAKAINKKRA